MLRIERPIDREHTVEVIDLVLKQLGERTDCPKHFAVASTRPLSYFDSTMPLQLDHQVG